MLGAAIATAVLAVGLGIGDKVNRELRALVNSTEVRERIAADGGDPLPSSPEEYAADIDREEAKWSALIRKLNLKVI